jgi:hypothetical protein
VVRMIWGELPTPLGAGFCYCWLGVLSLLHLLLWCTCTTSNALKGTKKFRVRTSTVWCAAIAFLPLCMRPVSWRSRASLLPKSSSSSVFISSQIRHHLGLLEQQVNPSPHYARLSFPPRTGTEQELVLQRPAEVHPIDFSSADHTVPGHTLITWTRCTFGQANYVKEDTAQFFDGVPGIRMLFH